MCREGESERMERGERAILNLGRGAWETRLNPKHHKYIHIYIYMLHRI